LTLVDVGWDDITSSQAAFYIATRRAMETLRSAGTWEVATLRPEQA
jgi:hypothetical protein